jgi:hypothetical protein
MKKKRSTIFKLVCLSEFISQLQRIITHESWYKFQVLLEMSKSEVENHCSETSLFFIRSSIFFTLVTLFLFVSLSLSLLRLIMLSIDE